MISIVIPTFNEERYLPLLLESIKKQSFKNYEIIVSDRYSKDKTREIARNYGCSVILRTGSPNKGRDAGARKAKYDILFLEADDILPENFLQEFFLCIKKQNLDLATCFVRPCSNKFSIRLFYLLKNLGVFLFQKHYTHVHGQCFFSKKEIFYCVNGFRLNITHGGENDYALRAKKYGRFRVIHNLYICTSPRRIEKIGFVSRLWKAIYPEIVRFFNRDINKELVEYEHGGFR
ncbi:glycosyltransferase [Candidatus Woesearchaeota archaeon]|nr:glycosyltransferase [Candidatus Woesearchaeota archaeon]